MSIYAFEGIGIIIPVMETCEKPEEYPKLVILVLILLTISYSFIGLSNYFTYGSTLINPVRFFLILDHHSCIA
jgi:amino acid permease